MQTRLQQKLGRLRGKVKLIQGLAGIGRVVLIALGVILATYLLDRSLRLPVAVRAVLLIVAIGAMVWAVRQVLVRPLRRSYLDDDLAGGVESLHPELRDRIRSTLDFQASLDRGDLAESPAMAQHVIDETLRDIEHVSFRGVARFRRAMPWLAAALVGALGLGAWASTSDSHFGIWLQRFALLDPTATWPRSTELRVLMPPDGSSVYVTDDDGTTVFNVAKGLDFTVNVVADRGDPSEVVLHFDGAETGKAGTRALPRVTAQRYTTTFERLTASFRFHVTGGDDDDTYPRYRVKVHEAPAVAELLVDATYPDYVRREPRTFQTGDVEVPVDTQLRFRIRPTSPLASGRLVLGDPAAKDPRYLALSPDGNGYFTATVVAEDDFDYAIELIGTRRVTNHGRARYRVLTVADSAPSVRVAHPSKVIVAATATGYLPLLANIRDDHGVVDLRLLIVRSPAPRSPGQKGDAPGDERIAFTREERIVSKDDGDPFGDRAFHALKGVELADLRVGAGEEARIPGPGDVIRMRIEADDNHRTGGLGGAAAPNTGRSREFKVEIIRNTDLERRINDRQLKIKESVRRALAYQQRTLSEAADVATATRATTGGEGDPAISRVDLVNQLLAVERRQSRLTADLKTIAAQLQQNLDAHALNRLEVSPVTNRIIDVFTREMRARPDDDAHRFRALLAEHDRGTIGLSDVLTKLIEMVGHAMEAADEASPAATRAMSAARAGADTNALQTEVDNAIRHQRRCETVLTALLEKLKEWEDYQEVIQLNKELIELQKDIEARTIDLIKNRNPDGTRR